MSRGFRRFIWKNWPWNLKGELENWLLDLEGLLEKKSSWAQRVDWLPFWITAAIDWRPLIGGHFGLWRPFLFPFLITNRFPPSIPSNLLDIYYYSEQNVGLMLAHRLRPWPTINPALVQCIMFAGNIWYRRQTRANSGNGNLSGAYLHNLCTRQTGRYGRLRAHSHTEVNHAILLGFPILGFIYL